MAEEIVILENKHKVQRNKRANYNGVDYVQSMMLWAKDNMSKEEIIEVIKGDEGKTIGVERLQEEIERLEMMLNQKKREFLKKTMALYFLKLDVNPNRNEGSLHGLETWFESLVRRN